MLVRKFFGVQVKLSMALFTGRRFV